MKEIKLTQGKVALVDDEDFELLNKFKWYTQRCENNFYARRFTSKPNRKNISMHREIIKPPIECFIDHKDHNGLNNQKNNLRICTILENGRNSRKRNDNSSGYKGVDYNKRERKFRARIKVDKMHRINVGYFNTAIEAAIAYDSAALKYHGKFANLNFKI